MAQVHDPENLKLVLKLGGFDEGGEEMRKVFWFLKSQVPLQTLGKTFVIVISERFCTQIMFLNALQSYLKYDIYK